jgi:hypothetical protein
LLFPTKPLLAELKLVRQIELLKRFEKYAFHCWETLQLPYLIPVSIEQNGCLSLKAELTVLGPLKNVDSGFVAWNSPRYSNLKLIRRRDPLRGVNFFRQARADLIINVIVI